MSTKKQPPKWEGIMVPQQINHRESLGFWLNVFGLTGQFAEIGCLAGTFSRTVLSQWKGKKYHVIDPWQTQAEDVYRERQDSQERYEEMYQGLLALAKEDERVNVLRMLSADAAKEFKNGQLDCVYIDGNHAYAHVMEDMDNYWPKVKIGGIMGGHDYKNKTDEGWFCEVENAVNRWTQEHGKVFYVCPCTSWFIHKTAP